MNAGLHVHDLTVAYQQRRANRRVHAIDRITFGVRQGEFVAVVGPSGCGKTSLLNVVAGLVAPESGGVLLDGSPIRGPGPDRAMVFQSAALMPWRTVLQNVAYGLELQNVPKAQREVLANQFIDLVGLAGFEDSFPRELSGGMQQRVNLARALSIDPNLLLLDEPLASLDAQTRENMQAELQRIWMEKRSMALFVTHQIDEAVYLADRVIVMSARPGRIRADLKVDIPRPRRLRDKRSSEFRDLELAVWELLREEAPEEAGAGQ